MKREKVRIKGSNTIGRINGMNNDTYMVSFENGFKGEYTIEELEFLDFPPVADPNCLVIRRLICMLNNERAYACMDIDNEEFIEYVCDETGLDKDLYMEIMGLKTEPSETDESIKLTIDNIRPFNRERKIGKSTYRICKKEDGMWYICETFDDGSGFVQAKGFFSHNLSAVVSKVNNFTKEQELISMPYCKRLI